MVPFLAMLPKHQSTTHSKQSKVFEALEEIILTDAPLDGARRATTGKHLLAFRRMVSSYFQNGRLSHINSFLRTIVIPARVYPVGNLSVTGACTDWTGETAINKLLDFKFAYAEIWRKQIWAG